MFRRQSAAILLLLACAGGALADPEPKPAAEKLGIAVLDFDPQNAPASDAAIVTEYVRQALVARGDFRVVDRKNMSKTLQEQAIQQTGCTSSECAVKLGKVLNVQKMVVGTYGIMEGSFRVLTAQVVDVQTSQIEKSAKEKGFQVSNADEAAETLVSKLFGGGAAAPAPAPGGEAVAPAGTLGAQAESGLFAKQAAAAPAFSGPAPRSYLILYGGTGTAKVDTYTATYSTGDCSTCTSLVTDQATWTFSPLALRADTPDFGLRLGAWGQVVGGDLDLFYSHRFTVEQSVEMHVTPVASGTSAAASSVALTRTDTRLPAHYLDITSFGLGGNLLFHSAGRIQFYGGLGAQILLNHFTSDWIIEDASKDARLSDYGPGFGGDLPLGFRFEVAGGFFYVEFREQVIWTFFTSQLDESLMPTTSALTSSYVPEFVRRSMVYNTNQLLGGFGFNF